MVVHAHCEVLMMRPKRKTPSSIWADPRISSAGVQGFMSPRPVVVISMTAK